MFCQLAEELARCLVFNLLNVHLAIRSREVAQCLKGDYNKTFGFKFTLVIDIEIERLSNAIIILALFKSSSFDYFSFINMFINIPNH